MIPVFDGVSCSVLTECCKICFQGSKRDKGLATRTIMFKEPRHRDAVASAPELLGMDCNYKLPARHQPLVNNDAPLDVRAKKP
jgi:hypothetical protein